MKSATEDLVVNGTVTDAQEQENIPRVNCLIFGVVMTTSMILAILGNATILNAYRRSDKLHTPYNLWIVAVAFCDLSMAVAGFPFVVVSSFMGHWVFGTIGCNWEGFTVTFLGLSSIFLFTAVSVHRFIVLVLHKIFHMTEQRIAASIGLCFLCGFVWAMFPLLGWGNYALEGYRVSCAPDWSSKQTSHRIYTLLMFFLCFFVPLAILFVCYAAILFKLWREGRRQSRWISQRRVKREIRVTVSVALTIGCFLLAWSPYAVVSLCSTFFDIDVFEISPMLMQLPCLMAKTACVWNPLVYVCHHSEFRKAILQLFSGWRTKLSRQEEHVPISEEAPPHSSEEDNDCQCQTMA